MPGRSSTSGGYRRTRLTADPVIGPGAFSQCAGRRGHEVVNTPVNERHRGADPRVVASVAIVIAAAAIALVIVYAVGEFVFTTVERFPS